MEGRRVENGHGSSFFCLFLFLPYTSALKLFKMWGGVAARGLGVGRASRWGAGSPGQQREPE